MYVYICNIDLQIREFNSARQTNLSRNGFSQKTFGFFRKTFLFAELLWRDFFGRNWMKSFIEQFVVKKLMGRRRGIRICPLKETVRFSEVSVKGSFTVYPSFVIFSDVVTGIFLNLVSKLALKSRLWTHHPTTTLI
jgi:hypothetical protein